MALRYLLSLKNYPYSRTTTPTKLRQMSFHFASSNYAACFANLPQPQRDVLHKLTLQYLDQFDAQLWYKDPIVSIVNGTALVDGGEQEIDTVDALGKVNGRQKLATLAQIERLKEHIGSYESIYKDLRQPIRQVESLLLSKHSGFLIGNQCIDFQKQDGITEIEEAIMANTVERRLNDLLLADEEGGKLVVNRQPIYVQVVSNFTNFLDLSRKTLRTLEVGIPVVVLCRFQTSQHSYRWVQLLVDLCADAGIDHGMITFLSTNVDGIKDITQSQSSKTGNLYATCARFLAAEIKSDYPNTVASTGGPNTLVCTEWKDNLKDAISASAAIESAGQCTALRHCVVPGATQNSECTRVFDHVQHLKTAQDAVKEGEFAGVFAKHPANPVPSSSSHTPHDTADAYLRIESNNLPKPGINEWWRKVVVDFTKMDLFTTLESGRREMNKENVKRLAGWLNENQPITLAVNGPRLEAVQVGMELWEHTGLVVNTVGSTDRESMPPALTCQARPQEAECFGEFPPRLQLSKYTKFPVIIPSSTPSYDAHYTDQYLKDRAAKVDAMIPSVKKLIEAIPSPVVRGYCLVMIDYLRNVVASSNPKRGFGERTALFGVQRPPLHLKTILRCEESTWEDIAPVFLLFYATTARDQLSVSVQPDNRSVIDFLAAHNVPHIVEAEVTHDTNKVFDIVRDPKFNNVMVGNFVSLYFPLGHVKSTMANDDQFVSYFQSSEKWVNTLF